MSLYGGFVYRASSLANRDPVAHPTILSGDLAGNDVNTANPRPGDPTRADNAWHVVTAGDDVTQQGVTATLDGLQIVDGYAAGPNVGGTLSPFIQGHADGGGVNSTFGSNLTINDTLFKSDFAASDGGGVFSDGSNLTVTNSRFLNNASLVRAGGLEGLNDFEHGVSHTSVVLNDYFQHNTCAVFGGALVGEGANQGAHSFMTIQGSTFVHNQAPEGGAAVFDTLTISITGSSFTGNKASVDAGAIATTNIVGTLVGARHNFATTITQSSFTNNVCVGDLTAHNTFFPFPGINFARGGGALVAYMNGYLNVDHCLFDHNINEVTDGGAILNGDSSYNGGLSVFAVRTSVTNSVFINNQAQNGSGGAIASESDHLSPTSTASGTALSVSGSIFESNFSHANGGAIALNSSAATIAGSLFATNSGKLGGALYAVASVVDGYASSNPLAHTALRQGNVFFGNDNVLV